MACGISWLEETYLGGRCQGQMCWWWLRLVVAWGRGEEMEEKGQNDWKGVTLWWEEEEARSQELR